jgi:hypothetical protein
MYSVRCQDPHPRHIPMQSDVFCLGLAAFQMLTFERVDRIFDFKEKVVEVRGLAQKMGEYGTAGMLVAGMLRERERERITLADLSSQL